MDAIERDFTERMESLARQEEELLTRQEQLESELGSIAPSAVSLPVIQSLMRKVDTVIAKAPFEQRKILLHTLIRRIEVTPQRKVAGILIESG